MADNVIGKLQFLVEVDNETGITNIRKFQSTVDDSTKEIQEAEKKQGSSFSGINAKAVAMATAVGTAFLKISKEVVNATGEIQGGQKIIAQATGATGESLEALMATAKAVYADADESFEEVANAIGEVNTRLGYTGEQLQETTGMFLDFAEATGQDVKQSVAGASQVMNQWNLEADKLPLLLDKLTVAGQASGISVSSLTANLTDNAGTLQAMGYSMDEAIGMMMSLEKQGIDSSAVLMGMKQSFAQSAKAGTDARQDWETLLDSISNTTDETTANSLAIDAFGNRVATTMVTALRNGKLNFDEFSEALEKSEGALKATDEAGKTTADRIEVLKHQLTLALAEVGEKLAPMIEEILPVAIDLLSTVLSAIEPIIPVIMDLVKTLLPPLVDLLRPLSEVLSAIIGILSPLLTLGLNLIAQVLSPVITVLGKIAEKVKILFTPIQKLVNWLTGAKEETEAYTESTEELTSAITEETKAVEDSSSALETEATSLTGADEAKADYTESTEQADKAVTEATASIQEETEALSLEAEALTDVDEATDKAKKATTLFGQEIDTSTGKIIEQTEQTEELEDTTLDYADTVRNLARAVTADIGSMTHALFSAIMDSTATTEDRLKAFQNFTASVFGAIGNGIFELGKSLAEGEADWSALGKSALKALSAIIRALAEEMTARAVLAMFSLNWGGAALLSAGAVAGYLASGLVDGWANSLAIGSDYVPYDGYPATLHRGEMVLTRAEADRFRAMGGLYGIERQASLPLSVGSGGVGSVNVNNNLHAVIEVDGTQLGVAVLKSIDDARPFVMG